MLTRPVLSKISSNIWSCCFFITTSRFLHSTTVFEKTGRVETKVDIIWTSLLCLGSIVWHGRYFYRFDHGKQPDKVKSTVIHWKLSHLFYHVILFFFRFITRTIKWQYLYVNLELHFCMSNLGILSIQFTF